MSIGASTKTRRFEFIEGKSSKFWEVTVTGSDVTVRFGKIGTHGQGQTKSFPTPRPPSGTRRRWSRRRRGKDTSKCKRGKTEAEHRPRHSASAFS